MTLPPEGARARPIGRDQRGSIYLEYIVVVSVGLICALGLMLMSRHIVSADQRARTVLLSGSP